MRVFYPRSPRTHLIWSLAMMLALVVGSAGAGTVLDGIKLRGDLRCGVSEGIVGFSERDADGQWQGFDVDFCRAVAAAVVGDPRRVQFVPLRSSTRFPALQAGKIDLLVRNTTWTLGREAVLKVQFPGILFYDWQTVLVPASAGITSVAALDGATLCAERGTNHVRNLNRYATLRRLDFKPLVLDSAREVADAFFAGRCAALTSDASQLAAMRLSAPGGPAGYVILPERIAKQPLSPVVWGGDPEWTTVVRWVLYALLIAEEDGFDQANVEARSAAGEGDLAWLSTRERQLIAESLSLEPGWGVRVIRAVGNYGELYERHFGARGPLRIERGANRLWSQGGLMYAPPID